MDEIEKRLRETSDACVKCYEEWRKDEHNSTVREKLQEAIHELRKVSSRLEIEMAVSERQEMARKPLPIPPHRASRNKGQNGSDGPDPYNMADDIGNASAPPAAPRPQHQLQRRRRPEGGGSSESQS